MTENRYSAKGYIAVLMTALLWSTGGIFIKMIPWSAFSINAGRCAVALIFKFITRKSIRIKFSLFSVLGGIAVSSTMTLFVFANKLTTAGNAITLQYSFPMFLILFMWLKTRGRPKWTELLTAVTVMAGVFLCCFEGSARGSAGGNFLAVASGITFAGYFFISSFPESSPDDANCIGFMLGLLTGLPSLLSERDFSFRPVIFVILLGVLQVGLAYILFEYGIKRVPAVSASFISAVEPVASPVWVALFYGERMGTYAVAGSALVIASMVFYNVAGNGGKKEKPV